MTGEPRRIVSYSLFWGPAKGLGYLGRHHRLGEFQYGLWHSLQVAIQAGWGVRVYHDGSVERVLARMRAAFPPPMLRCVRVNLPPDLRGRRYLGCLYRLLPADDPQVDAFVSRDLDDLLDPTGLQLVEDRWLAHCPRAGGLHYQSERYDTPQRSHMANMGWFGQCRSVSGGNTPSVAAAIATFARQVPSTDYYTADEVFLTDVWIPTLRRMGIRGTRLPSHPHRRGATRRPRTYRAFQYGRMPPGSYTHEDLIVDLH